MVKMNITERLLLLSDTKYRDFHSGLMPTVDKKNIIGIRIPLIRKFAKEKRRYNIFVISIKKEFNN